MTDDRADGLHTVGRWLTDRAIATPDRIAIVDGHDEVSYGELHARASRLAAALRAAGYAIGDRIATITGVSVDHVVLFFACARVGLILAPISWRLAPREIAQQLQLADPALLVVEDTFSSLATVAVGCLNQPPESIGFGESGLEKSVPPARRASTALPLARHAAHDDDALLLIFTSGTLASPKAAVVTHANCFWTNLALSRTAEITDRDVVLAVMPQYHVGGWNVQPLLAWWVGATVVVERAFDAGRVLRLIADRRITAMMGVPANYLMLAEHPRFADADLGSLRLAIVGGAPVPEPLLRTWHERGIALTQGYGLTEASPNVLCLHPGEARQRIGSVGRPYPHVDVRLVDPVSGATIEGAGVGELLVRGPSVFAGYFRDPVSTEAAFVDGWLRTGDLLERDPYGCYRVIDRVTDIFISGGESVAPAEVEAVLVAHPAVADAAVVGVPDARWGEAPVGFVVVRSGALIDEADLIAHCRTGLARFKVPTRILPVESIPRSGAGKARRRDLLELWMRAGDAVPQNAERQAPSPSLPGAFR